MVDFHQARFVPDHAALAIAGDISLAEARKLVEPLRTDRSTVSRAAITVLSEIPAR